MLAAFLSFFVGMGSISLTLVLGRVKSQQVKLNLRVWIPIISLDEKNLSFPFLIPRVWAQVLLILKKGIEQEI